LVLSEINFPQSVECAMARSAGFNLDILYYW
jgi:hypothetical protein